MILTNFLNKITLKPKKIFFIDSIGALITAIFLGLVLARLEPIFGMPPKVLYGLSFIACMFALYSFYCHLQLTKNWRPYLIGIISANLIYCCLTIGLVICYYQKLTNLGLMYFLFEIMVILILVCIELKTVSELTYRKD